MDRFSRHCDFDRHRQTPPRTTAQPLQLNIHKTRPATLKAGIHRSTIASSSSCISMTSITSGGESYLCSCGDTLRSRDDVQEHLKRWRQLKHDNRCPEPSCDEGHGRNVRRHWTAKHLPDALRPKLVCKKCSQSYVKRKDLMNHMSRKQCSFNRARVLPGHENGAPSRSALVNNILPTSGKDAFTGSAPTSSAFRQHNYHETERNTEISAVESRNNSNGSKPQDVAESQGHEQASRQHDYRWTPFTTNVTITDGAPVPNQNGTVANPLHDQQTFPQPFDNMYGLDLPLLDQVDLDLILMPNAAMSFGDIYPGSDAFMGSQKLMSLTNSGTRDRLSSTLPLAAARTLSSGLTEAVRRQSSARRRRAPLEPLVDFGASRTAGSREQAVNEASVEDACSNLTRTCSRSSVHHPGDKSARIRNLISSRSRPQPPAAAKRLSPRPPPMTASSWFEICLADSQKPKITPLKAISDRRLRAEPKKTRKDRMRRLRVQK